jgi:hypothetical protein
MDETKGPPPDPRSMRALAEHYVTDLGFSVLPLKPGTKGPPLLPEWKTYIQRRPNREELDQWFNGSPRNIAIVCGQVSGGLTVIDYDDDRAFTYCHAKSDELAHETLTASTGKGHHVYVLIRGGAHPRNYTLRQGTTKYLPVDIKGEGGYVVAPCSVHPSGKQYAFLGTTDELIEMRQAELDRDLERYSEEWPIVEKILDHWKEGVRHDIVLGLVKFLRHEMRFDAERTERVIRGICRVGGGDLGKTSQDVRYELGVFDKKGPEGLSAVRFLGPELYGKLKPFAPRRPSTKKKAQDEDGSVRYETYLELADGRIAEEIVTREGERFVLYDPASDKWEIVSEVIGEGETIRPRTIIEEERMALTIADGVEEYTSTKKLLEDMEELAVTIYDPGHEIILFRVWMRLALCSWIIGELTEGFAERYAPILPALGPPAAGKGRLLTVSRAFFYRSILFQKTKRVPSIFRTLQPYHYATLLLEEADLDDSTESAELVEFLNSRASGHPAVRYSSETDRSHWFVNFGYTLMAIRRAYEDAGLTSRTIPFPAESTEKDVPLIATREFATAAQGLVRKLLLWRLRHVAKIRKQEIVLPTSFKVPNLDGAHRVRSAFLPLLALKAEEPELVQDAEQLVHQINRRVVLDRSESFEGQLLNLVYNVATDSDTAIVWADKEGFRLVLQSDIRAEGGVHEVEETPIYARWLADKLNGAFDPHLITQAWRGFGQAVKARDRYGRKRFGSIFVVSDPDRLCRLFREYVSEAEDLRPRFKKGPVQSRLPRASDGGPENG